jgi:putative CocE/NonD family hydrolase
METWGVIRKQGRRKTGFSTTFLLGCMIAWSFQSLAQRVPIASGALEDEASLSRAIPALVKEIRATYKQADQENYLATLLQLQLAGREFQDAQASAQSLIGLRRNTDRASAARIVPFLVYARARDLENRNPRGFADAYTEAFQQVFAQFSDLDAAEATYWFNADLTRAGNDLRDAMAAQRGRTQLELDSAIDLVRRYAFYQVFHNAKPWSEGLMTQDDARRYLTDDTQMVKTADGASIAVLLVLPRVAAKLPTLLTFTIYANSSSSYAQARLAAAHGYIGAVAYTRGKGRSPDQPMPYEHDGADAAAVIDWLSRQQWSDGRVGMYGGSYNGFTQWAAAKHLPPALKAIMPSVAAAPGIDVPMEGHVFLNFVYPWPFYVLNVKQLDDATYGDSERWNRLNRNWYTGGKAYRDMDAIDGTANPIFRRWLDHPDYDQYWRSMIPFEQEFAAINIPVLATDGYLQGQGLSSLYYFLQHTKHNPRAEHYYVIGPWGHFGAQANPPAVQGGYQIDPVARVNIEELRFEWFDYVFKHGRKPELLQDRVNYEVMGANKWKHAPSVEAMAARHIRFHLGNEHSGQYFRLAKAASRATASVPLRVDLADRSDVNRPMSSLALDKTLDTTNAAAFVSDPFPEPAEISGLFSGQLDFILNKKDMDFSVALFEWTPNGEYFALSYYMTRASYSQGGPARHLLAPGVLQHLRFTSPRVTSRQFQKGSRLVVVIGINKQPDLQINYGTGKDVSDESISDAGKPLEVRWYSSSYLDIPFAQ